MSLLSEKQYLLHKYDEWFAEYERLQQSSAKFNLFGKIVNYFTILGIKDELRVLINELKTRGYY